MKKLILVLCIAMAGQAFGQKKPNQPAYPFASGVSSIMNKTFMLGEMLSEDARKKIKEY